MSRKHKKVCTTLNHIEHFLVLVSSVTGYVWIFAFASLFGILIGTMSSAIRSKICVIAVGIRKYESIIKKKKKKYNKIVLLTKSKLNSIEALIYWNIGHEKFVLTGNVLKEYGKMKEEIKKDLIKFIKNFSLFIKQSYCIVWSVEKYRK